MKAWFLLHYQSRCYKNVINGIGRLNIEHYTPMMTVISKRADSRTCVRIKHKPLFIAYLFLYFDLETVHTTTISKLSGVNGFVRFGGEPQPVPLIVIDALRCLQFKALNGHTDALCCQNVPPELLEKMEHINTQLDPDIRMASLIECLNSYLPVPVTL